MNVRLLGLGVLLGSVVACSGAKSTGLDGPGLEGTGGDQGSSGSPKPGPSNPSNPSNPDPKNPDPKNPDPKCTFNPAIYDVPGNGIDEDCSGKADDAELLCDSSLTLASNDAFDAAKALGLCKKTTGNAWGVVDAKYVRPDGVAFVAGSAPAYGLLPSFGVNNPVAGGALVALSSGAARAPSQPGYQSPSGVDRGTTHALPAGMPTTMSACPGITFGSPHDGVALELKIRVPENVKSMSFAHQFFTYDYKEYVCSQYNDLFVVMMTPKPADRPDGNIVVDASGEIVNTNTPALLRACTPATAGGLTFTCPLGATPLTGTGFEGHASTGWLKTTVAVAPGSEVTLRFAIWDSGDGVLDSTVLLDALSFSTDAATATKTEAK